MKSKRKKSTTDWSRAVGKIAECVAGVLALLIIAKCMSGTL